MWDFAKRCFEYLLALLMVSDHVSCLSGMQKETVLCFVAPLAVHSHPTFKNPHYYCAFTPSPSFAPVNLSCSSLARNHRLKGQNRLGHPVKCSTLSALHVTRGSTVIFNGFDACPEYFLV